MTGSFLLTRQPPPCGPSGLRVGVCAGGEGSGGRPGPTHSGEEADSCEGRVGCTCGWDRGHWGGGWVDETEKTGLWLWQQGRKDVGTRPGCMWPGQDAYQGRERCVVFGGV